MATVVADTEEVSDIKIENYLPKDSLKLLRLLQEACECSCYTKKIVLLKNCSSLVQTFTKREIEHLMSFTQYRDVSERVLDLAVVPSFSTREYYSFEKTDFKWFPDISECVFAFFIDKFDTVNGSLDRELQSTLSVTVSDSDSHAAREDQNQDQEVSENSSVDQYLVTLLPKLSLLIGAYCKGELWSSEKCKTQSLQLLNQVMKYFSCESPCELFCLKMSWGNLLTEGKKGRRSTLLEWFLCFCREPLSKDQWQRNPFLSETFCWIISQIESPYLSDHINQVMATALNFIDDHQGLNKLKGISCLHHLVLNTSAEELRWYNRAEVIYETLKHQLYSKESTVVAELLPCLFDVLKVLERAPELERHQAVLETLLRDAEGENLLAMRRVYICNLNTLIRQIGIYCVRHLKTIIRIISNYLEIDEGEDERARIDALKVLKTILQIAWPRIGPHAETILKSLLKFLVDINSAQFRESKMAKVQSEMKDLAIACLILLSKLCPDVITCMQALKETRELQCIVPVLNQIPTS